MAARCGGRYAAAAEDGTPGWRFGLNAAELVTRARSMLDRPTFYVAGAGGHVGPGHPADDAADRIADPRTRLGEMEPGERAEYVRMAALMGVDIAQPVRGCDCSGFVCWIYGLDRDRSAPGGAAIFTGWIWSDARGAQRLFRRVDDAARPLRTTIGTVLVYPKPPGDGERYGHIGLVTESDGAGTPTRVIHCSAENFRQSYAALGDATRANAIAETGPEEFFQHLAVPGCETIAAECTGMAL
jgi:hypothetical protein